MNTRGRFRVLVVLLLAFVVGPAALGSAWAEQAPVAASQQSRNPDVLTGMAGVAGAIGSFFYIPFKIGILCPGMALASGVSLAVSGGEKATAERLLRIGCTGTYLITPEMVRGQEEFQGSGR